MPSSPISGGRHLELYVDGESAYGDGGTGYPVAADALAIESWADNSTAPSFMRADATGRVTPTYGGKEKRTAEWECGGYLLPAAAGSTPDIGADLMPLGGFKSDGASGADTVETGSSTTTINATGHGYSAGEFVQINGDVRRIESTNANDFTLAQPLSSTPANGDAIGAVLAYTIKPTRDTTPDSVALWLADNNRLTWLRGAVPNSWSFQFSDPAGLKFTCGGFARSATRLVSVVLTADINNSTTTVAVSKGHGIPATASATEPYYLQVGDEVLKVIAVSGNTLTTDTRGTYLGGGSAASHSTGDEVFPYTPTPTTTGSIVDSTAGAVWVGDDELLSTSTLSLAVEMGCEAITAEHGDAHEVHWYTQGKVDITLNIEGAARREHLNALMQAARDHTAQEILVQQGTTAGAIFGVYAPSCYLDLPSNAMEAATASGTLAFAAKPTDAGGTVDAITLFFA